MADECGTVGEMGIGRETKLIAENQPKFPVILHKSKIILPGIELGPPQ
jgi:hypothetical protein